jgi:hypothetical protein
MACAVSSGLSASLENDGAVRYNPFADLDGECFGTMRWART